jgi:hypothetical protein
MNRILTVVSLVAVVAFATPLALAQKGDKGKQDDDQTQPGGRRPTFRQPQPKPPQPQPQPQPQPRRLGPTNPNSNPNPNKGGNPGGGQDNPFRSGKQPGGSGLSGNENAGRRVNPPQPTLPNGRTLQGKETQTPTLPSGPIGGNNPGNQGNGGGFKPSGRGNDFAPPSGDLTPKRRDVAPRRGDLAPKSQPDLTPPSRGNPFTPGKENPGNFAGGQGGNAGNAGKLPNTGSAGNDGNSKKDLRPDRIRPSGKPIPSDEITQPKGGNFPSGQPKSGGIGTGQPAGAEQAVINNPPRARQLGKPSGRSFEKGAPAVGGGNFEAAKVGGGGSAGGNPKSQKITQVNQGPVAASKEVANVGAAPSRMKKMPSGRQAVQNGSGDDDGRRRVKQPGIASPIVAKPQPKPVEPIDVPQGGKVYRGRDYHHEYSHHRHSSFAFGLAINDGHSSFAFGYSNYGHGSSFALGLGYGYNHHCHPYWHSPAWYAPVCYTPCYAVAYPVYYTPVYAPVIVDPYAYNCSSFAFGYSSFGGSAFSSFNVAYSSSHWGIGFGWTSAPCYSVWTPAYDPYVRAVWVDGYYELVGERVWVPGRYEEQITTPVTEVVVDPLGNSYEAVIQAGAVDYVWHDGYWTVEERRIWHPGHFEYVSTW